MGSIPVRTKKVRRRERGRTGSIPAGTQQRHAAPPLRYQLLGPSGLRVSELALGTMTFGDDFGWGASRDESRAMFDAYAEAGGQFIDTANAYTGGTSERLVGEFVGAERERFVIASKYTANMRPDDPNGGGNGRKNLVQSVEASLKRLGTDYLDVLWMHAWDGVTPVAETVRALDDLVRSGKVLYLGISDAPAWVVSQAVTLAEERGYAPFSAIQVEYSLVERTPERDLLPMAAAHGLSVLDWSPLAAGALTGKYLSGGGAGGDASGEGARLDNAMWSGAGVKYQSDRANAIARETVAVAGEIGCSPSQVAIAWLLARPGRHIPILGARKRAHLVDNLGALDLVLAPEHLARLDAASRIELGFPHDFLGSAPMKQFVFGQTWDRLDLPATLAGVTP